MCIVDFFNKFGAYATLKNMVFPNVTVYISRYWRGIIWTYNYIKKSASFIFKTRFWCGTKRIDVKAVGIAPIWLVLHSTAPNSFCITNKFLLLTLSISFTANDNYHIFRIASGLLDCINRNYGFCIFAIFRIIWTKVEFKTVFYVYIPILIWIILRLSNGVIVFNFVRSRAHIWVCRRSVATGCYIIISIEIKCRSNSDIWSIRRLATDSSVRLNVTHIVVAIGHRCSEPIWPFCSLIVGSDIIWSVFFPNIVNLFDIRKEYFLGRIFIICTVEVSCNIFDIII